MADKLTESLKDVTEYLYLVQGRADGDASDTVLLVEAPTLEIARAAYREAVLEEHGFEGIAAEDISIRFAMLLEVHVDNRVQYDAYLLDMNEHRQIDAEQQYKEMHRLNIGA